MNMDAFIPLEMADEVGEMEFRSLAAFNDGHAGVFWSEAGGPSPWEMHPECDELLHVLEGEIEVEVLPSDGGESIRTRVCARAMLVVPRGCWHRQKMIARTKEFYLTPGPTLHSDAADPRS